MNKLVNGELLAQVMLESRFASKIGFTLVFSRRIENSIVVYAVHRNKQYVLSTVIPRNLKLKNFPYEVYFVFAVVKTLNPRKVFFNFEKRKGIRRALEELMKLCDFEYVLNLFDIFGNDMKATHVIDSLLMSAEDGCFLKDLCEIGISLKSSNQEYRAEMYKLLGSYPCSSVVYFKGCEYLSKRKELHEFLLGNIPVLSINETILHEDNECLLSVEDLDIRKEKKLETLFVDNVPSIKVDNDVLLTVKNEKQVISQEVGIIEGSVDL